MLHTIVQYDVTKDATRFAMRFALAILFRRVETLITVAELLESARITVPKDHVDRFKDNFEEALEVCARDGLIGSWTYEVEEESLPKTRWTQRWLSWTIRLAPRQVPIASAEPVAPHPLSEAGIGESAPRRTR
jgi:hypothetical protein